jgi:type II secretory pathway component GspD/PulD (secretin)
MFPRSSVLATISVASVVLSLPMLAPTSSATAATFVRESARPAPAPQPAASPIPQPVRVQGETRPAGGQSEPPATDPAQPIQDVPPADRPAATSAPAASGDAAKPTSIVTTPPRVDAPAGANGAGNPLSQPPASTRQLPRTVDNNPVTLGFKDEPVTSIIPFIQEWTGKAVIVRLNQVKTMNITIANNQPIPKNEALNLVFQAFKINGLGVVETDRVILIDLLTEISKSGSWIVLPPEIDVMSLNEDGNFVVKVFRLKHAKASDVFDRLQDTMPDYATISVDANSNQIVLTGDVGLAKKTQLLINLLDVPPFVDVRTETFRIQYQDATIVADSIRELFESSGSGGAGSRSNRANQANQRGRNAQPGGQPQGVVPQVGVSEQLVVSVLPALNQITVRAEPTVLDEIRRLISTAWDLPPTQYGTPFRTYQLKYTDPLKVQTALQALLEGGSAGGGARRGAGANRQAILPGGQGGGATGAEAAVANVFRIEAYPDSNRLVVISKTPQNFPWLDEMVDALDQPLDVGLPRNIQLKYASAFEVAQIINVLLAEDGAGTGIDRPEEDLTGIDFSTAGGGGSGSAAASAGGTDRAGAGGAGGEFTFPWQSGRGATGEQSPVSPAIGKVRVVPIATQNSLIVLGPPQIQESVLQMIQELDRPGRQVMITAVLAEVSLGDGFSFGLRTGSNLTTLNGDENAVGGEIDLNLNKEQFANDWFDLSTLDISTNVGFLLQALKNKNDVRILQEPRVFTSDNKEAKFFSGQDITFQTGETTGSGTGGGTTSSFEDRAVGIGLNVRPRITRELNVNMNIEILLSSLNLSVPSFNNNPVVDRRQTNTEITVKNGQTIVISGIRREDETTIKRALPLLGEIPVLDLVFSSQEKKKTVSELVIFITPVVVENPDQNDSNFNEAERLRLQDLRQPLDARPAGTGERGFFDSLRAPEPTAVPPAAAEGTPIVDVPNDPKK